MLDKTSKYWKRGRVVEKDSKTFSVVKVGILMLVLRSQSNKEEPKDKNVSKVTEIKTSSKFG